MVRMSVFLILILATVATVAQQAPAQAVRIADIDDFVAQQQAIRADMAGSKKFKHVADFDKRQLYTAQDEIFALLAGRSSTDELDSTQLVALYNAQEVVNSVLAEAELDRPVCERQTVLGSRRIQTVCLTVRERRDLETASRQTMLKVRTCDPSQLNCGEVRGQ
jgi:hypothetical protein